MMEGFTTGRLLALIRRFTGNLASLNTPSKADLVSAINSLNPQFFPVLNITIAEAIQTSNDNRYTITAQQLGGNYRDLFLKFHFTQASANSNMTIYVNYSNGKTKIGMVSAAIKSSGDNFGAVRFSQDGGMAVVVGYAGNAGSPSNVNIMTGKYTADPIAYDPIFVVNATITSIELKAASAPFEVGSGIIIFAAS